MTRSLGCIFLTQLIFLQSCSLCSNKVVAESLSPDKEFTATWYVRDCGATTDFATIVSVHRSGTGFRDDSDMVFVASGRGPLQLLWTGPRKLSIECRGCSRKNIFKQLSTRADVDISY